MQARKQRTGVRERYENKRDKLSDTDIFAGLIKVAKPEYIEPENQELELREREKKRFKTVTSYYKNCTGAKKPATIPFTAPSVVDVFNKRVMDEYESVFTDMQLFISNFIDRSLGMWLVGVLLDLVESDKSIAGDERFYVNKKGGATKKAELCNRINAERKMCLPSFLIGIFHYIIMNRQDNTIGIDTIVSWHEKTTEGKKEYKGSDDPGINWNIAILGDGDVAEIATSYMSPLKEFELAISDHHFMEFIRSEPFETFIVTPETDASKLDALYRNYQTIRKIAMLQFASSYQEDESSCYDSYSENFQYSERLLSPKLLAMSERLVVAITEGIHTKLKIRSIYNKVDNFVSKLSSYNRWLRMHFNTNEDALVFSEDSSSNETISLCNQSLCCEAGALQERLLPLHVETKDYRMEIYSLYKEIVDDMIRSSHY